MISAIHQPQRTIRAWLRHLGAAGIVLALALLASTIPAAPMHAESSTIGCGDNRVNELLDAVRAGGIVSLTPGCTYTFLRQTAADPRLARVDVKPGDAFDATGTRG